MRMGIPVARAYRGRCSRCLAEVFTTDRVGDAEVHAMLEHLWTTHPDVLCRPDTLPLEGLLRLVWIRMV